MTDKLLDALTSAIYLSRLILADEAVDTDDKRLRAAGLYPEWTPGVYKPGDICNAAGQTWECFQAYDSAVYPDIPPGTPSTALSTAPARRPPGPSSLSRVRTTSIALGSI